MAGEARLRSVLLIDKPKGPTSFWVSANVSSLFGGCKTGHSGTLDPNATGLMLVALGEAVKAMPVLMGLDKEYEGVMMLHAAVPEDELRKAMESFLGDIIQTPPVRSRVARRPRKRTVHDIEILGTAGRVVRFRVLCEAGTYIRKIAHDAGQALGTGAHLADLRRTRIGPFRLEDAVTLEQLNAMDSEGKARHLMPLEKALADIGLPQVVIRDEAEPAIRNGSPVRKEFVRKMPGKREEGYYAGIFNGSGSLVCLATFVKAKGVIAKTERVFLEG